MKPHRILAERERTRGGRVENVSTVFLTGRKCRFSCLMCDLRKHTTDRPVPPGAIPAQIRWALERLPPARHIKLYNSANFFDPGCVPPEDYPLIADLVEPFETVIVENHPLLTGDRCIRFDQTIRPGLQVAMGLETIHPEVLPRLNKKMEPEDFRRTARFLSEQGIASRAFILLRPPYMNEQEGIYWACRSLDYAFDSGCSVCTVIPTRGGNGIMEVLEREGFFSPPHIGSLEEVVAYGISLDKGFVFADTWDLDRFVTCESCSESRIERLNRMNLEQRLLPGVSCSCRQ